MSQKPDAKNHDHDDTSSADELRKEVLKLVGERDAARDALAALEAEVEAWKAEQGAWESKFGASQRESAARVTRAVDRELVQLRDEHDAELTHAQRVGTAKAVLVGAAALVVGLMLPNPASRFR